MAQMRPVVFPESVEEHLADQEHVIFELLEKNLPDEAIVVYAPKLPRENPVPLEPDFVVFWEKIGIVVIEAKNWFLENIVSADRFNVHLAGEKEPRDNKKNEDEDRGMGRIYSFTRLPIYFFSQCIHFNDR